MKKTLRITFNGKSYEVEAEILGEASSPAPSPGRIQPRSSAAPAAPAPAAPAPSAAPAAAGEGAVTSPLAGKVVSIDAPVGSQVAEGQTIMTLEAMKMNTTIPAPMAGTVKAVHVQPGDGVEEGQLLMTIE